jgi:hypothetical protein
MNQQKLEEKLYDLLIKNDEPLVTSISGEYGIGKTYFWQKVFLEKYKNELSKKQIAYVSLFGHNSLNDIKTDIVLQISKTTKYVSKFKDKLKSIKGAVFKDVIICFDDFDKADVVRFIKKGEKDKYFSQAVKNIKKHLKNYQVKMTIISLKWEGF